MGVEAVPPPGMLLCCLLVDHVFVFEDEVDLCCRRWALQLLTIQHLFLQLLDGLSEIGRCYFLKNNFKVLMTNFI